MFKSKQQTSFLSKSRFSFGVLISLAFLMSQSSPPSEEQITIEEHVKAVASHLIGVMDTSTQAAANADLPHVRITSCQVWLEEGADLNTSHSLFLYQEQALAKNLNQPYRQRFLRLAPSLNGKTVESKSFVPNNPEQWIGLCNQSASTRLIRYDGMSDRQCSVFLVPREDDYMGKTQPGGCATNLRGAAIITNTIILHSEGMDTWDRGFDAQGNQVWGANNEAYQFRWLRSGSRN